MAADKDYVLGVAVQLQTESVAAFEAEVRRQLEAAASRIEKGVKIRLSPLTSDQNAQLEKMLAEQQAIIDANAAKQKASNEKIAANWKQRTVSTGEQIDAETRIIEQKLADQQAILESSAAKRKAALSSINQQFNDNLVSGPDGSALEKQQKTLEKYVPQLNAAVEAQGKLNKAQSVLGSVLTTNSDALEHFGQSLKNMAMWGASGAILFGGGAALAKGMGDAIRSQQEQVMQGFYYPQGKFTPEISQATQAASIAMAREYGDEVMHVQEAMGLWAKVTNGEYLPTLALTNQAMKLNAVTGMNMEEIFRASVGAIQQMHQPLSRVNDLYQIGIGLATRYGGGMKLMGGESQDASRQMIEGMDRASAVLADTGMSMEQVGAAVAVTMQKMNIEGAEAGSGLARAFAALGRGKPHEILQQYGIQIEKNNHLLEDLAANWSKVGNALKGSVQSSALEYLDVITSSVKEYEKAVALAGKSEKSDILDNLFSKIEGTDAFKLMQAKAGIESLAISLGKELLPDVAAVADYFNNSFIPTMINAGPQIMAVSKDLGMLAIAFAGFATLRLVGSAISGAIGQWQEAGAAMSAYFNGVSVEEKFAQTSLTDYQRALLATMTDSNTVTAEMETQIRALAAVHNVSVDSMISAWLRARNLIPESAAQIEMSEDGMAGVTASVASQIGLEAGQVESSFAGMATAAESSAGLIQTAFLKAIPVIGQVLLVAGLAKGAYDWARNSYDQSDKNRMQYDKAYRGQRMGQMFRQADIDKYYFEHPEQSDIFQRQVAAETAGFSPDEAAMFWKAHPDERMNLLAQAKAHYAGYEQEFQQARDVQSGAAFQSDSQRWSQISKSTLADVKKQLEQSQLEAQGFLKSHQSSADYGSQPNSGDLPGSTKAATQALDAQSQAVKRNVDAWASKISADEKGIQTARLEIQYLKDHKKSLDDLTQAYEKTKNDIGSRIRVDQLGIGQFGAMASSAKNEPQRQRFLNEANKLSGEVNNLKAELALLDAKENADVAKAQATEVKGHFEAAMAGIKISMKGVSADSIPQLQALHKAINDVLYSVDQLTTKFKGTALGNTLSAWATTLSGDLTTVDNKTKTLDDNLKSFLDTNTESMQTALSGNQFELANIGKDSTAKAFAQAVTTATDKYDKFIQEWDKWESKAGDTAALENVKSLATAWYQSSIALAQYNQALEQAKASPTYAAITALGNDIGSTVSSDVMAMFTQGDRNQISAIQSQITALQNEKNLLTGQNNIVERDMLDRKIKQLEAEKSGIDQRMQHPNFLKAIQEDMVKAIMKGLTDKFTKSLQDAFLNSILPKQQTVQDKANTFINDNTSATQHNTQALSALTNSIRNSGSSSSGFSLGSVPAAGSFFSDMGMSGSAASVSSGGSVGSNGSTSASSSSLPTLGSGSATIGTSPIGGFAAMGSGAMMAAMLSSGSNPLAPILGMNAAIPQMKSSALNPIIPSSFNGADIGGSSGGGGGGFWSSGKGNAQHILGAIGGLSTAVQGYDQGGFTGSLESGLGMFEALSSMGVPPQIAIPVAAVDFILSMFHPHYNPSQNPDMFPQSGFAQGVANAQGFAATQATGGVYEDPGLKQQLGGMTQLQYLNAWYNQYPGGQGLNEQGKQLWDEIGHITGNGKGYGVTGLHQGNVFVSTSGQNGSPQVGESGNWQQVLQDIDSATNQLYALENQDMSGKGTWISVNSYGAGGGGSASFSPWSTPGLSSSDVGSVMAMPYPALGSNASIGTSIGPDPGSPSGGPGGGGPGGVGGPGVAPMSVTSNVYLNSDLIAQQVNSYNIQRTTSGFSQNY